jgi:L-ascorbate metabolism protein UlaG (beta-lactamase superfamily)
VTTPYTTEETASAAAVHANGSSDPRITAEGTIAYLITLDDGYRIMYRDSGGQITDYERAAMQRVGRVDLALAAVAADVLDSLTSKRALDYMRTYKPDVYIPAHHDADRNGMWRPTEPIFQALKNENPSLITISKQYREPTCLDTEDNIQRREKKSAR